MRVSPYLDFDGTCREAFEFYQRVLGGTLDIMRFGDAPSGDPVPEAMHDRVMHARLGLGDHEILGSDTWGRPVAHDGIHVTLTVDDGVEAERIYRGLSEGGEIEMELQSTFWAKQFAMFSDRFGIRWMISGEQAP